MGTIESSAVIGNLKQAKSTYTYTDPFAGGTPEDTPNPPLPGRRVGTSRPADFAYPDACRFCLSFAGFAYPLLILCLSPGLSQLIPDRFRALGWPSLAWTGLGKPGWPGLARAVLGYMLILRLSQGLSQLIPTRFRALGWPLLAYPSLIPVLIPAYPRLFQPAWPGLAWAGLG